MVDVTISGTAVFTGRSKPTPHSNAPEKAVTGANTTVTTAAQIQGRGKSDPAVDRVVSEAAEGRRAIDMLANSIDRADDENRLYLYGRTRRRSKTKLDELPELLAKGLLAGEAAVVRTKRRMVIWV